MSKLLVQLVSVTKTIIEPLSRTAGNISTASRAKLNSIVYLARTTINVTSGLFFVFYNLAFRDSTAVADNKSLDFTKGVNNSSTLTDTKTLDVTKNIQEIASFSDAVDINTSYFRYYSDSYILSDSPNILLLKQTSESIGIQDSLTTVLDRNRTFFDQVAATDDVNGTAIDDDQNITFFTSKSHFCGVGESASFQTNFIRQLIESTNISSNGLILSQSYIGGTDYFLEDYVGVSRAIT